MKLVFHVQGSAAKPYQIVAHGHGDALEMFCTCPAGSRGRVFCKHLAALLVGDASGLVEPSADVGELARRAVGSPLIAEALEHRPAQKRTSVEVEDIEGVHRLVLAAVPGDRFAVVLDGEPGADERRIGIHLRFGNGKPRRGAVLEFKFARLTALRFDFEGSPEPRGPSSRPWHVVAKAGRARTFSHIGMAASALLDEVRELC